MRHRAHRHLPAFLRLQRVRPRRRLASLATRPHPSGRLPSRASTRLVSALAAVILVLSGGVLAVGALDDDTVPAVDDTTPSRSVAPDISRTSDRPTLSPLPDPDTPDQAATDDREEPAPHAASHAPSTPTPDPAQSQSHGESPLPVPAPHTPPIDETPSVPTSATPDLSTQPGTDGGEHDGTATQPAESSEPADRTAPQTEIDSRPSGHDDSRAQFTFHASERASFVCSLDGAGFRPCESGVEYRHLQPGWHDFAVRATDTAGNADSSPAGYRWHTSPVGWAQDEVEEQTEDLLSN